MGKKITIMSILILVITSLMFSAAIAPSAMAAQTKADLEAQRKAAVTKARKTLDGTTWMVYTTLQQEGKGKPEKGTETFTFSERRITTGNLASQGYAPGGSNYSTRIEADGTVVWETMQKHEGGEGEALLRGDLKGNVMTGVIDIQPASGSRKIYYFTSRKEKPQIKAASTESITPAVTTTTTTTTTEPKKKEKKKRGWGW